MKQFYLSLLCLVLTTFSFAQSNIAEKSGNWSDKAIWSKEHVPVDGEVVEIPKGITVTVDQNENTGYNIDLRIWGNLVLNNGKLRVGPNSKITLFENATIVSSQGNNDKIDIGNVSKYVGSQGTLFGPLVASKNTSASPSGFMAAEAIALPVKFAHFSATLQNGQALVQWSTTEEVNAAYFEVERSLNGATWMAIAQVKAAGNSSQLMQYSYTDRQTTGGTVYYRIKQVDLDGRMMYTAVQTLRSSAATAVNIIAVSNQVAVQFLQPLKGKVEVLIVNRAGQVVARQLIENGAGQVVLNSATTLKGTYFVAISNDAGLRASKQVVL